MLYRWMLGCCLLLTLSFAHASYTLHIVTENFPQFQYINGEGELVGTAVDKVKAVLDKSKINYRISVETWTTAYNTAARDENTCIFSMAKNEQRGEKFNWVFPISKFVTSFYALKSSQISIDSIEEAKQYKVAVIKDNYSHQFLVKNGFIEGYNLVLINSFERVFELLATRHKFVDLVILSDDQFEFKRKHEPVSVLLEPVLTLRNLDMELYFACNKNLPPHVTKKIVNSYKQLGFN
ncbi:transporter substrate-binding domain-containing protein [Pseudoalteromonas luteoviolacea]|uniref:Bacterial extracellular solute-binding protein, family 3 n=1 Tax=Pseudoalteromonas luteoviolacea (strain 2ta16) TaxID=1353533 RepID=V4JHT3_PSEL2|nr:transporter substrate-binding domain-containing protein [Pseudoalteromonas luteoviolacea]ESP94487.1 bacterial extracellular solute-binding protein, family 3 [Pseudoalteromonas luteoviolacea 2ta16]